MSKRLDIFLHLDAIKVGWSGDKTYHLRTLAPETPDLASSLAGLRSAPALSGSQVDIYLADELLFFTSQSLPLQTPDIKKAIDLQLDMLSPFGEDSLAALSSKKMQDSHQVNVFICQKSVVLPLLENLAAAGAHLTGIFPESQRYLTRATSKQTWSLWSPGPSFAHLSHFDQGRMINRDLCSAQLTMAELKNQCAIAALYSLDDGDDEAAPARPLLDQPAEGRHFDMLPASFRRPDYLKKAMLVLAAINITLLILLGIGKGVALYQRSSQLDVQIEASRQDAEAAVALKGKIKKLKKELSELEKLGANADLIDIMAKLSAELPDTAYLDQLRLDQEQRIVTIQGYTNDLAGLTAKIPDLGSATLKSTLKRRNQTYFHLEVSLP